MTDKDMDELWKRVGAEYNLPSPTPREEIWSGIQSRIFTGPSRAGGGTPMPGPTADSGIPRAAGAVVDLEVERQRRSVARGGRRGIGRVMGWSVAAAAVLVLGIGIGRMSAPSADLAGGDEGPTAPASAARSNQLVARAHLGRSEALLTMVRADARAGRVDPAVAEWAEDLLAQTRLLLDRPAGVDPTLRDLLLDVELVLVQVVGAADSGRDDEQSRTELELTLKTLEEGGVLPRIQAQIPPTMAGT